MKKWSFQIPNSSAVAGNDGEGERVGFEASSTSQFMSREVLGMQSSSGMLVAVPGAIKGRRSTRQCLGTAAQFASKLLQLQLNLSEALPLQSVLVGWECSTLSSFKSCFFGAFGGLFLRLFWGSF